MRNPVVDIAPFGPVYRRKIHVYYRNVLTGGEWKYTYSTNAYRTCRDALAAARASYPNTELRANFAKD